MSVCHHFTTKRMEQSEQWSEPTQPTAVHSLEGKGENGAARLVDSRCLRPTTAAHKRDTISILPKSATPPLSINDGFSFEVGLGWVLPPNTMRGRRRKRRTHAPSLTPSSPKAAELDNACKMYSKPKMAIPSWAYTCHASSFNG